MSSDQPQFYSIQSQIGLSNWVLTATRDGQRLHITRHGEDPLDDDLQLWQFVPDSRLPNACYIVNPFLKKVIRTTATLFPGFLELGLDLAPLSVVASDPRVLWERPPDNTFGFILTQVGRNPNGEVIAFFCLTVGAPLNEINETAPIVGAFSTPDSIGPSEQFRWQCTPDTTKLAPTSIDYDLTKAVIDLNVPPTDCQASLIDNSRSSIPITQTLKLTRAKSSTKTTSYSKTDQHSLAIANTFKVKLAYEKVAEVENSTTVTVTDSSAVTIGTQQAETSTVTDEVDQTVTVPAGKQIKLFVRVNRGKVTVPYVAHIERTLPIPGIPSRTYDIHGEFTNVNAMSYSVVVEDVHSQNQVTLMEKVPFDVKAGQTQVPDTL